MKNNDLTLKPIKIHFVGTGSPVGNDPSEKAERMFSQNLVYLCKDTARTPKELSELLHVPMPFIEEELQIQCSGKNGRYGLLTKVENEKYISNFVMIDSQDYAVINEMYKKNAHLIALRLKIYLENSEQSILNFPFKSKQRDLSFIVWSMVSRMIWAYKEKVNKRLKEKYYSDIETTKNEYYTVGFVSNHEEKFELNFYGCDGIRASNICGYEEVHILNIYGRRIKRHFCCGHNISLDPQLMMTLKSIEGINVEHLSEQEKEISAKAIYEGYLLKENNKLYPKILVMDKDNVKAFDAIVLGFIKEIDDLIEPSVDELYKSIKKYLPKHLMDKYNQFSAQMGSGLIDDVIERSIKMGTIKVPETSPCAEGTWMIVSH